MAVFEIPLDAKNQEFDVAISGTTYHFRVMWNDPMQAWILDISDNVGNLILSGTPLITGADLLAQYQYLHIGADVQLIVYTTAVGVSPDEVPTHDNLGIDGRLYYLDSTV